MWWKGWFSIIFALLAVLCIGINAIPVSLDDNVESSNHGMVSTTNRLATLAAVDVLKRGGNAIDAAAVIQFVLSVVQPHSTGIGGGSFTLIYNATTGAVQSLDAREEAPNNFHAKMFCKDPDCMTNPDCACEDGAIEDDTEQTTGGHPVGVPGVVAAISLLLEKFGTISLAEAVEPAAQYAENGFEMYDTLYTKIKQHAYRLSRFNASRDLFLDPKDATLPKAKVGELFFTPDQAKTLRLIGEMGPDVFYRGELAEEIVRTVQASVNPVTGKYGVMTLEDLDGYRPVFREPISTTYRGRTLYGVPPPSGSAVLLQMLNLLEGFDMPSLKPFSVEAVHRMIEVQNAAFADRLQYMADPDYIDVPVEGLLEKAYARQRRDMFRPYSAVQTPIPAGIPKGAPELASPAMKVEIGTTHFSVVDSYGNVVAMTTTLENNLGCAVVVPGRGFLLNNELTDFENLPGDSVTGMPYANRAEGGKRARRSALGDDANSLGGKRPRSSMTPIMVFNGTDGAMPHMPPYLAIGSPGGSSILGAVFNVLVNILDFKMDLQEAIDYGRVLGKNGPAYGEEDIYLYQEGEVMNGLIARGFNFSTPKPTTSTYGIVESIMIDAEGHYYGAADLRREPNALAKGF